MQNESAIQEPGVNGQGAFAGFSREFHNLLADLEDLVKATTSLTGDDLVRAKARLGERIASARESAGELGGVIAQRAGKTVAATDSYVHQQPWVAIGIGAALGVLVGVALANLPRDA